MRAQLVELLSPRRDGALLRASALSGAYLDFGLEVGVHTLMAAVVLRLARSAAYQLDSQRNPPGAQPCQPRARLPRCEGLAVVELKRLRKTKLAKDPLERATDRLGRVRFDHLDTQHIAAERIAHRQWLAALAVARQPPALEVQRPDVVGGCCDDARRPCLRRDLKYAASLLGRDPAPTKDAGDGPHAGHVRDLFTYEQAVQLLGTPPMQRMQLQHAQHRFPRYTRRQSRAPRAISQPLDAVALVSSQPLVACLSTDLELATKRNERLLRALCPEYELLSNIHETVLLPGHPLALHLSPMSCPYQTVGVTHLVASDRTLPPLHRSSAVT